MDAEVVYAISTIYLGCILNNVFLEYLVKSEPGSGNLITFSQFLFVVVYDFFFYSKCGQTERKIPMRSYWILVSLFFSANVLGNWVFAFNIPVPLHMIFRAGSLIANMIMGIIILKKRYSISKYISVIMITVGIIICTFVSSGNTPKVCSNCDPDHYDPEQESNSDFLWWVIGIILLSATLLLSARTGIYQKAMFDTYGNYANEALYYSHLLSLPGFILYAPSIIDHAGKVLVSEPYNIPILNFAVPILVVYLLLNAVTQYMCISSVYALNTKCSSLTVTLVTTLRKFLSLLLSIVYFNNPFTLWHWFGTILVFTGTIIFFILPAESPSEEEKKRK